MKYLLHIIILSFLFSSCSNSAQEQDVIGPDSIKDPKTEVQERRTESEYPNWEDSQFKEGRVATYENASVYAASTEYVFQSEEGKRIFVRHNQFPEKGIPNPIIPENMLESGEDIEGPPGANPDMVGKQFVIVYKEHGEILGVWEKPENF